MTPKPLLAIWLASFLFAVPALCQERTSASAKPALSPDAARAIDLIERDSQVKPILEELLGKFGPRLTSSSNLNKACEWAKAKFESYGLKASLHKWGEWEVGFDRGALSGKMISPEEKKIDVGTNAWAAGTNGPARGPALAFPKDVAEADANKAKYKGAWVLLPRGKQLAPANEGTVERALQDAGIHGYVTTEGGELIHTGGRQNVKWDDLPKRVTFRVQGDVFKELSDLAASDKPAVIELNAENKFVKGPIPLYNVIADLPGTEKPEEFVIIGGHIDSWDGAQGATDNGTGTATTLEVARILAKSGVKPKRTIRFMLWSGEEQGLLGSRQWIRENPDVLPNISAVLVHDEGTNYADGMVIPKAMETALDPIVAPLANLDPKLPFEAQHRPGLPAGVGSDHDSFLSAGVPGFFWSQNKGDVNYNHGHHTQFDTLSVVRHDYQKHTTKIICTVALGIANLPEKLSRENLTAPRAAGGNRPPGRRLSVMTSESEKGGITVDEVLPDGIALKIGIKAGDKITKIGDTAVSDTDGMRAAIQAAPVKSTVTVVRDGKDLVLEVEWPPRPQPREGAGSRPASAPAR